MVYTTLDIDKFPKTTGVYKIYFDMSDKVYVGSTYGKRGFYGRWLTHISQLVNNKSKLFRLQSAFNKYTGSGMKFEILELCDKEQCLIREQYYIDLFNSYDNGYNSRKYASNNGGIKMSENAKKSISDKWKKLRDLKSEQVQNLYKNGKTTREICAYMNISRGYLSRIIKENKIEMRNDRGNKKRRVYQYGNGNEIINQWESLNECSRSLGFNTRGIYCVLSGQCIHYKGYFFSYNIYSQSEVEEIKAQFKLKSKNLKYRNIRQIDDGGNLIKIWNNINEIVDFLEIKRKSGVYKAIHEKVMYRGYFWLS